MNFFSEYEKRAFVYLGLTFMWIVYWIIFVWAVGKWFGLPVRDGIFGWLGLLMLVGFVDLMLLALGNLVIGQYKMVFKREGNKK